MTCRKWLEDKSCRHEVNASWRWLNMQCHMEFVKVEETIERDGSPLDTRCRMVFSCEIEGQVSFGGQPHLYMT